MPEKKPTNKKTSTSKSSKSSSVKKTSGKSTTKANVNRVVKAAKKYDTSKNFKENKEALAGVVAATATSASRASNKKQRTFFIVLTIILIIAFAVIAFVGYQNGWFDTIIISDNTLEFNSATYDVAAIKNEQLSIHFLELGNGFTGDSVYIKAGETDILIDAGSRQGSAKTIAEYVDNYCTDNKLEYVVATHAHQDHIAGFVGTREAQGIFDKYKCDNIIEFARTNATSQIYRDYCDKRNQEQADGANVYTALDCVNNRNGAKKTYDLTGDGSITMEILYQKYYEQQTSNENNYSVCLLISQGDSHYLFTGDLEGDGEASLVKSNGNLPEVKLYKGGHHGSYTAGTATLLHKIKPQCICVCCCAGSVEYTKNLENTFPAQKFINRIAPYTDAVYVTTAGTVEKSGDTYKDTGYASLNGNIVYGCTNGRVSMYFSKEDTKLKDTEWFKQNRTCPSDWK